MKIHRFYIKDYKEQDKFTLTDKELSHQLSRVLKIKTGERVIIFNGLDNYDYLCNVSDISGKEICFTLIEKIGKDQVVKAKANLYFAIPKSGVEDILRACTEIGAYNFYPIITERTEKKDLNYERMIKIVVEASEQCGRNSVPKLNKISNLKEISPLLANSIAYHTSVTQNEFVTQTSTKATDCEQKIKKIFVGPEGGFTNSEIEYMTKCGAEIRNLPTYTLRTVTAAPVCLFDALMTD